MNIQFSIFDMGSISAGRDAAAAARRGEARRMEQCSPRLPRTSPPAARPSAHSTVCITRTPSVLVYPVMFNIAFITLCNPLQL